MPIALPDPEAANSLRKMLAARVALGSLLLTAFAGLGCEKTASPSPLTAIDQGWSFYTAGDFNQAAKRFETARKTAPDASNEWLAATYGLASTLRWNVQAADIPRAESLFSETIAKSPASDWAAWSALSLARSATDVGERSKRYERVVRDFSRSDAADEAVVQLQATRIALVADDQTRDAAKLLEAFLRARPQSSSAPAAHTMLAAAYEVLGDQPRRQAELICALESRPADPENPIYDDSGALWMIACVAEFDAGDFPAARRYYQRFIDEYPTDVRVYAAKQALTRLDQTEAKLRSELAVSVR